MKLYEYTINKLNKSFATKYISKKIIDKEFGEQICKMVYDSAIQDFIDYSEEFLMYQLKLEAEGKYKFDTQIDAYKDFNWKRYLNGLLFSHSFWINHYKIFQFFIDFCDSKKTGRIVDVPIGTGIYLSEFIKRNPKWVGEGYDISKEAVMFSQNLNTSIITQKDIFDIKERYDKIICSELLEHLENPETLLIKLSDMLEDDGEIFFVTAIWAAAQDHIYLFKNVDEVRDMLKPYFNIKKELILNVFSKGKAMNYACILKHKCL